MKATILDLRCRILKAIERGETVRVLHHGKEKALIVPIAAAKRGSIGSHQGLRHVEGSE